MRIEKRVMPSAPTPVGVEVFRRGLCLPGDIKMTGEELAGAIAVRGNPFYPTALRSYGSGSGKRKKSVTREKK